MTNKKGGCPCFNGGGGGDNKNKTRRIRFSKLKRMATLKRRTNKNIGIQKTKNIIMKQKGGNNGFSSIGNLNTVQTYSGLLLGSNNLTPHQYTNEVNRYV